MKETKKNIIDEIDEIIENDKELNSYNNVWSALSSFLVDFEHLKGLNNLTQSEIALKSKTTQSAISRLECMKGKPTYELLRRLSLAVGGELFITPMAKMTVVVPYDLQEKALTKAKSMGISIREMLEYFLRNEIDGIRLHNKKSVVPTSTMPDFYTDYPKLSNFSLTA